MTPKCTRCGAPEGGCGDRGLGKDAGLWRDPADGAVYSGLAQAVIGYCHAEEFDCAYSRLLHSGTEAQLARFGVPKAIKLAGGLCQLCRADDAPKKPRAKKAKPPTQGSLL